MARSGARGPTGNPSDWAEHDGFHVPSGTGFTTGGAIFNNYSSAVLTNNLRPAGSTAPLGQFFGEYNAARDPRIVQLGVKVYF